ncbi:hypothetical protein B0T24DRAFT_74174 [Lasiosphaeria ovina]|uniref:Peptidase S8/S53 domain-containing protein n=1 Tax=Lasiosphaeria ovina TaxID=92902 RepID=A0AAE0NMG3_9PEZI|nr:hypothetical protein B0T24DRAFT_74174 [Lasiosphaeria ovina]
MAFGFPDEVAQISTAMQQADSIKGGSLVFLAAASNEGSNGQEMFPAFMEYVISVRGTEHHGGFYGSYDPPPAPWNEGSPLYGTLGHQVPYDLSSDDMTMSGCSPATVIMAGIVALIQQYVAESGIFDENVRRHIHTRRGILQILKGIGVSRGNNRYYIAPWPLLEWDDEKRQDYIRTQIGRLPTRR